MSDPFVPAAAGTTFMAGADRVVIKASGKDTGGLYSLMHWTVAPRSGTTAPDGRVLGHVHERYEETFYILRGRLSFLVGTEMREVGPGDFVRVPLGGRHGFVNPDDTPVEMLVSFAPGGMEELFRSHFSEREFDAQRYVEEAARLHHTHYELP